MTGESDYLEMRRKVIQRWKALLLASALGAVLGYLASYLFPRMYEADVLLTPIRNEEGSRLGGLGSRSGGALAALTGLNLGNDDYVITANLALLKSKRFVQQFVTSENLLPVLFYKKWDSARGDWKLKEGEKPPTLLDAYQLFTEKVMAVGDDRKTGLITVTVTWYDGAVAARWANLLVARVNATTRDIAIQEANQNVSYLVKEMRDLDSIELRQSAASLLESQMNKRMLATTRPDFAFRVLDPAQPPDPKHAAKPRRIGFFILGGLVGLVAMLIFVISRLSAQARRDPSLTT